MREKPPEAMPRRGCFPRIDFLAVNLALFAAAAVAARILWLDRLPGVNGDETWYGLWVLRCVHDSVCPAHTPSGNLINPFYMVLVAAAQAFSPPSVLALRLPAVLCGIGFVAAGYVILRPVLGRQPAAIFAILAAALPVDIVYSRFGWDAAETGIATILALGFALRGRMVMSFAALLVAFLVHPTNVLLLPLLCVLLLRRMLEPLVRRKGPGWAATALFAAVVAAILLVLAVKTILGNHLSALQWVSGTPTTAFLRIGYWQLFFLSLGDLFSGATVYNFLVRDLPLSGVLANIVTWSMAGLALSALVWRSLRASWSIEMALFSGLLLVIFVYGILAGPSGLQPGFERYGLVLIAPILAIVAAGLGVIFGRDGRRGIWLAALIGWLGLASIGLDYFVPLLRTGGRTADPASVAAVDPKQQAAGILAGWGDGNKWVVASDDLWIRTPLIYFLYFDKFATVIDVTEGSPLPEADFAATFAGSTLDRTLAASAVPDAIIRDISGRPVIDLWRFGHPPAGN